MKVRCIDNESVEASLVLGEIYDTHKVEDDFLQISPDPTDWFRRDRFEVITEAEAAAPGIKHDGEKPDMSLLSSTWIMGVARVLTFGKRKYAAHNWRKGLAVSRLIAAALRHIFQFLSGEDKDPETGESHLYHASCCLMFAAETVELRPQFDDRWRPDGEQQQQASNK